MPHDASPGGLAGPGSLTFAGQTLAPDEVVTVLRAYVSPRRQARIEAVLAGRTRTVVPVVEGLIDQGNVSAVMRSAEALGFLAMHVVTHELPVKGAKMVSQGADKWLDVAHWPSSEACAAHLQAHSYTLVAMHPEAARPLDDVDFTRPTALLFGNEKEGLSAALLALADRRCAVAMTGFTQSFNISVAAGVALYHARQDRLARQGFHGDLPAAERDVLRALYYLKSVRHARRIIRQHLDAR